METFLVGYDLNKAGQNYKGLIEHLKKYPNWCHFLDSTWLIRTTGTSEEIRNELKKFLDSNDKLMVTRVSGRGAAWSGLDKEDSEWIKKYL